MYFNLFMYTKFMASYYRGMGGNGNFQNTLKVAER